MIQNMDEYTISCSPRWSSDPVISNMYLVKSVLAYLVSTNAPEDIIADLCDLATELDVSIDKEE